MPSPTSSSAFAEVRASRIREGRTLVGRIAAFAAGRTLTMGVLALGLTSSAIGQAIWDDSGTIFNAAASWASNDPPDAAQVGQFNTAKTSPNNTVTLNANITVKGLEFTTNSGAWVFGGTNGGSAEILSIGSSGIVNNSSFDQTFNGNPSTDLSIGLAADTAFTSNGSGGINLTSGLADFQNNGYTLTLNGTSTSANNLISEQLSGTGGITKDGSGTWTMGANHDYSGVTTLRGGVLAITNLSNGTGNGHLGNPGTSAATHLVLDGGTLRVQSAGNDATNRLFTLEDGGGTIEASGGGTVNFSNTGTIAALGASNRTLTLGGTYNGAASQMRNLIIDSTEGGVTSLTKAGASIWTLYASNTYTGATTVNDGILRISAAERIADTSALVVNGSGVFELMLYNETVGSLAGNGTVRLNGATVNRTLTAGGDNTNTTFSGTLSNNVSGAGDLVLAKTGSGTLTLSGNNTYEGGTNINGGTLALASSGALSTTGTISFGGGALQFSSANTTDYSSRFSTAAGQLYRFDTNGQSVTLASDLTSSGGSLTKLGTGMLTLTGANTYDSGTNINGGTLALGSSGAIGTTGTIGFGGGTLQFSASNTTDYSARFSNAASQAYSVDTNGQSVTFASNLTSTGGSLTKLGVGTLTLSGANAYTGTTTISQGTVIANDLSGATSSLGNAASAVVLGDATNQATLSYTGGTDTYTRGFTINAGGGRFDVTTGGQTVTMSSGNIAAGGLFTVGGAGNTSIGSTISGSGGLTKIDTGTLTLTGPNTYTGATTISRGILSTNDLSVSGGSSGLGNATSAIVLGDGSNTGTLSYTGNTDTSSRGFTVNAGGGRFEVTTGGQTLTMGSAGIATSGLFTVGGAGNTTLSSTTAISGGGGLYKDDAGTLTISGTNAHTGGTTVAAGVVTVTSTGSLAASSGSLGITGGTLNLDNAAQTVASFNGSVGTVNLGTGNVFTVNTTTNDAFSGSLGGSGTLVKSGAGSLTLSGNNSSLSGGITLNAGTLNLNSANSSGTGTLTFSGGTLDNSSGGALTLAGNNAQTWAGNLTFTGSNSLNLGTGDVTLTGNRTVTVNANTLTIGGAIGDGVNAYGITKEGAGTLVFGGVNTYDGTTTVNAGTLTVNSGAALASANSSLVMGGGTLNLNNAAQTIASLAGSSGTINLDAAHTLTINNSAANTYSGSFGGSGNLVATGSDTLTLFGNSSSFSGASTIETGSVVNVRQQYALGTGNITVQNGATLQLQGNGGNLTFGNSASSIVTLSGAGTGVGGNNAALINVGGNITRLNNSIVLAGATTISSGTTSGANLRLGGSPPGPTPGVSAPDNDTLTLDGNALTLIGSAGTTLRVDANIRNGTGAADVTIDTAGTVEFNANKNEYTGATHVQNGTLIVRTINNGFAPNTPTLAQDPINGANSFHGINGTLNIGNGSGGDNTAIVQLGGSPGSANNVIKSTAAINIASDGHLDLNGNIQNVGKLTLNGGSIDANAGSLYLDYANTSVDVNLAGTNTVSTIAGTLSLTFQKHAPTEGTIPDYVRTFDVGQTTYNSPDLTISGTIINGGFIKEGAGLMNLTTSNNEYLGRTTVAEGILRVNVGTENVSGNYRSSLGAGDSDGSANADTVVASGATLQLQGVTITREALTLAGDGYDPAGATPAIGALHSTGTSTWGTSGTTGRIKLDGDSRITSASGLLTLASTISSTSGNNYGLTIDGAGDTKITGSISTGTNSAFLTKTGTGTLTLRGDNGYQGATNINEGVVVVQHSSGLGANTSGVYGTTVASGAELQLENVDSNIVIGGETLTISGTGTSSAGALRSTVGANSIGGAITLANSSLITANSGASLTLVGGVVGNNQALTVGTATQNGNITVSGNYTTDNSLGSLTKNGSGSLTLSGSASTVGAIVMNSGTMTIGSASTTAAAVNVNGGTLNFDGTSTTTGNISVNGGALTFGGTSATTGQVNLIGGTVDVDGSATVNTEEFAANAGTTLTIASGGTVIADYDSGSTTFSGAMAGSGTFEKAGAGTLVFNNSFDATNLTLEISGGTLKLSSAAHITFDTIKITGDTILDFSNSANTWLSSAHLEISANVQVTVINWIAVANNSAASTIWYANQTINSGSLGPDDQIGTAPLDQIVFQDLNGPNFPTTWVSNPSDPVDYGYFDHEIRPTPEPATYGAIFLSACFALLGWRRYRASRRAAVPAAV